MVDNPELWEKGTRLKTIRGSVFTIRVQTGEIVTVIRPPSNNHPNVVVFRECGRVESWMPFRFELAEGPW